MDKLDTLSNYRVFRLPALSNLDISDLKETTMSPSQVNTSINSNNQDAGKQLLDACRLGDLIEVKQLVDNGAPLSADWLGTSPLHVASQYGHTDTVDILLKAGASRDTRTKVDRTPLHSAALEGHLPIVSLLLSNGAEIDAKDLLKMTPLHWAVERGHYDVVEHLLENGADVTLQSKFDKTPIDIAYDNGRTDMIPLLEKHVNTNRSNKSNNQVLAIQNIKTRPTILPNKSNRNQKLVKTPSSTTSNHSLNDNSISSTNNANSNANNKSNTMDSIKKMMNNSTAKKDTNLSPNKINTRSSSNNTATLNMSAEDAFQWLEKNGLTATSTTSNGKDDSSRQTATPNKSTSKNNIITIAVNSNFNHLIKNSQNAPFVIINSNDLDDKKKMIKLDKVSSATKNNNNSTAYSTVESSELDDLDDNSESLRKENQTLKSENKLLKDEIKSIKLELVALKKDLEKKDKIIDDFKKRN